MNSCSKGFRSTKDQLLTMAANLVLMTPGAMAFTLMLSSARDPASAFDSPIKAVLVTEYGAISCKQKQNIEKLTYKHSKVPTQTSIDNVLTYAILWKCKKILKFSAIRYC